MKGDREEILNAGASPIKTNRYSATISIGFINR
jgi:hypothetical protein